jgi:predicted dinucleotide-binding enzyme
VGSEADRATRRQGPQSITSKSLAGAGRPAGSKDRVALPIAGDDPRAKEIVAKIIDRTGFDSVDAGTIAESWRQQPSSSIRILQLGP